jgi:hypothetical protein
MSPNAAKITLGLVVIDRIDRFDYCELESCEISLGLVIDRIDRFDYYEFESCAISLGLVIDRIDRFDYYCLLQQVKSELWKWAERPEFRVLVCRFNRISNR